MLISWFRPGSRAYGVPYAAGFGVAVDPRRPVVLDGDPELFHHAAERSPYAQSHIAYALCFDSLLDHRTATEIHHRMLDAILPARLDGAILTLGIHHSEPGPLGARDRSAIHCFISCRDLLRGRYFQPAYHSEGQYRIELAQELINQCAPYTSPKDPEHAREVSIATSPRTAGGAEILRPVRSTIRLLGDELSSDALHVVLCACGAMDVVVGNAQPGQYAATFAFRADDGRHATARVVVRSGQVEKLMRGSSLRRLMGDRYVRSPEMCEVMRGEFLTQVAIARKKWEHVHDVDPARWERVIEWGHSLEFTPLQNPLPRLGTDVTISKPIALKSGARIFGGHEEPLAIGRLLPPTVVD